MRKGLILVFLLIFVIGCGDVTDSTAICEDGRKVSISEGCITDDGLNYFEEKIKCVVAGCSSQLCVLEENAEGLVTTCEFREEYGCLEFSECGYFDGKCKWKETEEYLSCLREVKA